MTHAEGHCSQSLAAMRMNIKTVVMPWKNRKDLEDIPDEYRKTLKFVPVKNFDQVLEVALVGWKEYLAKKKKKAKRGKDLPPMAA